MSAEGPGLRRFRVASVLLVLVGALSAVPAFADERERDSTYKFSFLKPGMWISKPITPDQERYHVVRWFIQKDFEARDVFPETCFILHSKGEKAPKAKEDETQEPDDPPEDLLEAMKSWISATASGHAAFVDPKAVKSKDGIPGRMWIIDTPGSEKFRKTLNVLAVWTKPDEQYAMWLRCGDDQRKKNEEIFVQIVRSFQWFDDKAKEVSTQDALADLNLPDAKKASIRANLVKGWKVIASPKKNYVIVYNTKGKRNDRLAEVVADRIEKLREELYEKQFVPKKTIDEVSVVRICGDEKDYWFYGGPEGSAGYWSWKDGELVLYDAKPAAAVDDDTLSTAYHEAFHQYIYYGVGKVDPHSWFNEGHGDYYAGARLTPAGVFEIRPFNWRLKRIKAACAKGPFPKKADGAFDTSKGGYTPLREFLRYSQSDYYEDATVSVNYAQGWSLIYFLREGVPKNPEWKAKWGGILERYYETLRGSLAVTKPNAPAKAGPASKPEPGKPADPGAVPPDDEEGEPLAGGALPPPGSTKPANAPDPAAAPSATRPPAYDQVEGDIEAALEAAFKGVNLKELEAAWRAYVIQIPSGG
jgi:hypothetical protein